LDEAQLMTVSDFAGYPFSKGLKSPEQGEAKQSQMLSPQSSVPVTNNSHAVRTLLACVARQALFIHVSNNICFVV
jgi:hypothetical protein